MSKRDFFSLEPDSSELLDLEKLKIAKKYVAKTKAFSKELKNHQKALVLNSDKQKAIIQEMIKNVKMSVTNKDKMVVMLSEIAKIKDTEKIIYKAIAKTYSNYATYLFKSKDYDQAIDNFELAIKYHPDSYCFNKLGNIYTITEEHDKALESYNEAAKLSPTEAMFWGNSGVACLNKKDYISSIGHYEKALIINPNPLYCVNLAEAWFNIAQDKLDGRSPKDSCFKALEYWKQAARLEPKTIKDYSVKIVQLSKILIDLVTVEAIKGVIQENAIDYFNIGEMLSIQSKHQEALRFYEKALAITPNFVDALAGAASACEELNRPEDASKYTQEAQKVATKMDEMLDGYIPVKGCVRLTYDYLFGEEVVTSSVSERDDTDVSLSGQETTIDVI